MPISTDQVLDHIKQSLQAKQSVVAAPAGQPAPPPGMMEGGALPPVGASPGAPIQPLGGGAMPPEMMGGAMPPEMMGGAMPPEMMGGAMPPEMAEGAPPPPEDPIAAIQQEVADLRGLMQQLIDGQTAIIESLVGGSESLTASAPAADSESPEAVAPPAASPATDNNLIGLIQQDLRA